MNTKNFLKIGILGYGQIGQAIAKFYKNPLIKDLKRDDGLVGVDILHVCIPFNKNFVKIVSKEISKIKPKLTIIHSTVAVGSTKKLADKFLGQVVHSPVRGVHPDLYGGIKTFIKYIGADNKKAGLLSKKHLEGLRIKTKVFDSSKTTEALKLWDTTQYGWMIILNKEIKKWCDKNKVDFNEVYKEANKTYAEGYQKLGKPEVIRPYLKYIPGGCGGHCVLENTVILRESVSNYSDHSIFDFILSMGKKEKSVLEEKPYLNKVWLYGEYWGKCKSAGKIAKETGCTEENILAIMKRRNIPRRDRKWTKRQVNEILRLSEEGKNFKEISDLFGGEKTYEAIRNVAYKNLKIKSNYNPAVRNEEIRRKISASLRGIDFDDWDGFKEAVNSLVRKSVAYQNWRKKIFERDDYTCQKCKKRGKYMIAHHIANFSDNSKLRLEKENGITLCKDCHIDFHDNYTKKNNNLGQIKEYLRQ
jgi:hypothetical protein